MQKNIEFFEVYGVSSRTRGSASADIFLTRGEVGLNFRDFVRTAFMDGP